MLKIMSLEESFFILVSLAISNVNPSSNLDFLMLNGKKIFTNLPFEDVCKEFHYFVLVDLTIFTG